MFVVACAGMGSAAGRTLGGGVSYQLGDYSFTQAYPDTTYEFSATAPALRYALDLTSGPWRVSEFLTTKDASEGQCDDDWDLATGDEEDYGRVTSFGGDVAYLFDLGSFRLGPPVGYRDTVIAAGFKYPAEGRFAGWGYGIQASGMRLGAEVSTSFAGRFSVSGSIGYSPSLAVFEIYEDLYNHVEGGEYERYVDSWQVLDPDKSSSYDVSIDASARLTDTIEIVGGYRYESAGIGIDPTISYWGASGYTMKASLFHLGARCSF